MAIGAVTEGGRLVWLRNAVLAVFIAALIAGIFLPLYSDEIGWRLQERAGFEGVDKMFVELCGPNTISRPPFWMMPARYYSALFNANFAAPIYVRISGILYALAWTAMLLTLISRAVQIPRDRIVLSTLAIGFLGLGTIPLQLIWSRPEQPIVLAFTAAMLVASSDWRRGDPETRARTAWLRSLGIAALALIALSYHLKAVFTAGLFLTCLFLASRGRAAHIPRIIAALLVVGATIWAAKYWIPRLECPNEALEAANATRNNTGAAIVGVTGLAQLLPLLRQALGNISLYEYIALSVPRDEPMSAWLALNQIGRGQSYAFFLTVAFPWSMALLFSGDCLLSGVRRSWRERRLEPRLVLSVVLVVTVLGWSATQHMRNAYEVGFIIPMLVMAMILALATYDGGERLAGAIKGLAALVGIMSLLSVAVVTAIYGPSLARAAGETGYVRGQPYTISLFGYADLRRDMLAAARKCGISNPDTNHALMLDDVTYFTFMKSRMPEHRGGFWSPIISPHDPVAYLRAVKSDGLIAECDGLPPDIQARAKRQGQFCCIAPPNW